MTKPDGTLSRPTTTILSTSLLLALGLALGGCSALFPPSAPPATDSATGEEIEQTDTDVFALAVGDCLNDTSSEEVAEVPIVDCADEHDFEVYAEFEVAGDEFPGVEAIRAEADETCLAEFEAFAGIPYEESMLGYTSFTPTEESWTQGDDRLVSCIIGDPSGKTTGSLAGAGI